MVQGPQGGMGGLMSMINSPMMQQMLQSPAMQQVSMPPPCHCKHHMCLHLLRGAWALVDTPKVTWLCVHGLCVRANKLPPKPTKAEAQASADGPSPWPCAGWRISTPVSQPSVP